jgi:hypothetical protein
VFNISTLLGLGETRNLNPHLIGFINSGKGGTFLLSISEFRMKSVATRRSQRIADNVQNERQVPGKVEVRVNDGMTKGGMTIDVF